MRYTILFYAEIKDIFVLFGDNTQFNG